MKELRKVSKTTGKMRKIRRDSKYDEKYARQLFNGIRYKEGLSIIELCRKWRINDKTYYIWVDTYSEFKNAHLQGKADYAAYWHEKFKDITFGKIKGNGGCAIFALTNIEGINWSNKVDVHSTSDDPIQQINIKVLPSTKAKTIEHQPDLLEKDEDQDE